MVLILKLFLFSFFVMVFFLFLLYLPFIYLWFDRKKKTKIFIWWPNDINFVESRLNNPEKVFIHKFSVFCSLLFLCSFVECIVLLRHTIKYIQYLYYYKSIYVYVCIQLMKSNFDHLLLFLSLHSMIINIIIHLIKQFHFFLFHFFSLHRLS